MYFRASDIKHGTNVNTQDRKVLVAIRVVEKKGESGEVLALPSAKCGAFLRMVSGLSRPDSGTVEVISFSFHV